MKAIKLVRSTALTLLTFWSFASLTAQIDLSLTISQDPAIPAPFSLYSVTAVVSNAGPDAATGVVVDVRRPAGVVYEGGNEFAVSQGTFAIFGSSEGNWMVDTIPAGDSATIVVNYFVLAQAVGPTYSEVLFANETDVDSTPGNGTTVEAEDDEATTAVNGGFVPDLTLSNLLIAQSTLDSGEVLDFFIDINNEGAGSIAQNFLVQAFLSVDSLLSLDDVQNGTIPTGTFDPFQTVADVAGSSSLVGLSPGSYFLILFADANGQVVESIEGNNLIVSPFTISSTTTITCQLTVDNVSDITCDDNGTPTDPSDDFASIQVFATNGNASGLFDILDPSDNNIGGGEYGGVAAMTIQNLQANQGNTVIYTLRDAVDSSCTTQFTLVTPAPCTLGGGDIDLSVSISQDLIQPAQYSFFSVTSTVSNSGGQVATGVVVDLPLPQGLVYEGGNEFVATQGQFAFFGSSMGEWSVGTLAPGESATIVVNYFVLAQAAPSSYVEVLAANEQDVDSTPGNGNGQVNEDDEASTLINGGFVPDLTLTNLVVVQNPIDSGQQLEYTFDINNVGAGSIAQTFIVQSYISTDNQISTDDLQNGTVPTGAFAGGQTVSGVQGVSIPVGLSPGNYFLILEADANRQVLESNETNNTIAVPFAIDGINTSTEPCDAIADYQASFAQPAKVSVNNDAVGNITVNYINATGVMSSFTFDGPAELGVTPVADDTFEADDVICTTNGFAVSGTYRDTTGPANAQPFLFQLDASGAVVLATIPPFTISFTDLIDFSFIDIDTSGATGDVIYMGARSFGRSYQIAAFDDQNQLLWADQLIGDLVTNRIGGAVLSEDNNQIYFSYRDGNSQSWPRLRGVNTADGTTNWEVLLADLVTSGAGLISGNVSQPFAMPNGDVVVGFTVSQNITSIPYAGRFDATGNVIFLTQLPGIASPSSPLFTPQFVSASGDIVFTRDTVEIVVTGAGELETCSGGSQGVDLELSAVSTQAQPLIFDVNNITFTLTNTGSEPATGVTVAAPKPAGVVYTGGNEYTSSQGTFSTYGTNVWTVGDLAPGATATLTVNYFSLSATGYEQYAEVLAANEVDVDSTPGNGNGSSAVEDDEVFIDLGVTAPQPLILSPNPVSVTQDIELRLELKKEKELLVIVSDLNGRTVFSREYALVAGGNKLVIPTTGLQRGVYIVSMPSTGLSPKRVVIQE